MSNPLEQSGLRRSPLRDRFPVIGALGRVDDAIYFAERAVVTTAMLVMCLTYVMNIVDERVEDQLRQLSLVASGQTPWTVLVPGLIGISALFFMSRSMAAASPALSGFPKAPWLLAVLGTLIGVGSSLLLVWLPDGWVCAALVVVLGAVFVMPNVLDAPVPLAASPSEVRSTLTVRSVAALAWLSVLFYFSLQVPNDNAWATRIALFLLLWASFLGASMATYEGRHLSIDAVRKAIPARLMPWFNGVSHLAAGAFTFAFMMLAWRYWMLRVDQVTLQGEIPPWLSTLAIPVPLALMSVRFIAKGLGELLTGALGLHAKGTPAQQEG
jgi:TRAP-type C4-dicarboxylate transport system permease small subunit